MRKLLLVTITVIMVLILIMSVTACKNGDNEICVECDRDAVVIAVGGSIQLNVKISNIELKDKETIEYVLSAAPEEGDGISVAPAKVSETEYLVTVKGLKVGCYNLGVEFSELKRGKVNKSGYTRVTVNVIDAALKIEDIYANVAENEQMKLGYEYTFIPKTYPANKTDGLKFSSTNDGILQRVDGYDNKFRVVGIGRCDIVVSGLTVSDFSKTFTTVAGDDGIAAFLEAAFPADTGRIDAQVLSQLTDIELDSRFPATDLTALKAMPNLNSILLQSLTLESIDLAGMYNLNKLELISCNSLKSLTFSDIGELNVSITGSSAIDTLCVENIGAFTLVADTSTYTTCRIKSAKIKDVNYLSLSDSLISKLVTMELDSVASFGSENFNFSALEKLSITNCASGYKLYLGSVPMGLSLNISDSNPGSIDTFARCDDITFINMMLNADDNAIHDMFASVDSIVLRHVGFGALSSGDNINNLSISNPALTKLNLVDVQGVVDLTINAQALNEVIVQDMPALAKLTVNGNRRGAGEYTISGCDNINTLTIKNAPAFKISDLGALTWLQIEVTGISELDLHEYPYLTALICNSNSLLTSLDCSDLSHLYYIEAMALTSLTSVNIYGSSNLRIILASGNPKLSKITTGINEAFSSLEKVQVNDCAFESLDFVKSMPNLKVLDVANNSIGDIVALRNLQYLQEVYLNGNTIFNGKVTEGETNVAALAAVAGNLLRLSIGIDQKSDAPTGAVKTSLLNVFKNAVKLEWLQAYNLNFSFKDFSLNVNKGIKYLDVRGNQTMTEAQLAAEFTALEKLVCDHDDVSQGYHGENSSAAGATLSIYVNKKECSVVFNNA